ncbi:MAG: hypothetical protein QXE91_08180 [Thermofilaceae archaeon]
MQVRRSAQMLVAAVLVMGLFVMSFLVAAYQTHALFLRTRSIVVREIAGAITADFNRALAAMLALATRSYYDHYRFTDFTSNFEEYGLQPRDLNSAKDVAYLYLNAWANVQRTVYAEYGVQISWHPCASPLPRNPRVYVYDLFLIYWNKTHDNKPYAASYACAQLQLNITNVGFYHWTTNSLIGLVLIIDEVNERSNSIVFTVLVDNGTYYGLLLAKGWVEVYLYRNGRWEAASIKDVTYEGLGRYNVTLDESKGSSIKGSSRVLVVVSDERGILVVTQQETATSDEEQRGRRP